MGDYISKAGTPDTSCMSCGPYARRCTQVLTSSGEIDGEEVPTLLIEGGFKFGLGGNGEVGLL